MVHSDKPPASGAPGKTIQVSALPNKALPSGTLEALRALRTKARSSAGGTPSGAVLFAAAWCGYCRQARAYRCAAGVPFTEHDIDTASGRLAFVQADGTGGVPLLLFDGHRVLGFSKQAYGALVAQRR